MSESKSTGFLANSFTDLMASLAVIFILLTVVFIKSASEKSEKTKEAVRKGLAEVLDRNQLPLEQDPADPLVLSVRVSESLLKFAINSAKVSSAGVEFINGFFPTLAEQLCKEEVRAQLDSLVIEGHTDRTGEETNQGTNRNIQLSQERALSVLTQALNSLRAKPELHECLLRIASASGRGSRRPVIVENKYDSDLSRRVEIKIRVKSTEQDFFTKAAR